MVSYLLIFVQTQLSNSTCQLILATWSHTINTWVQTPPWTWSACNITKTQVCLLTGEDPCRIFMGYCRSRAGSRWSTTLSEWIIIVADPSSLTSSMKRNIIIAGISSCEFGGVWFPTNIGTSTWCDGRLILLSHKQFVQHWGYTILPLIRRTKNIRTNSDKPNRHWKRDILSRC